MILTLNNKKLEKAKQYGIMEVGLSLLPYNLANEKINLCPFSTPSCISSCLNMTGRGSFNRTQESRKLKTLSFLNDRVEFMKKVSAEITYLKSLYSKLAVRLNVISDINFQKIKIENNKNIFELHPDVIFLDYTKNPYLISKHSNYNIIYSADKYNITDEMLIKKLKSGQNVAMVFKDKIPAYWNEFEVIDGDKSDLEWINKKGVISGLIYKKVIKKGVNNQELIKNSTLIYG